MTLCLLVGPGAERGQVWSPASETRQDHLGVFASDAAEDGQREGDEGPDDEDDADGAEGQGCRGAVHDRHGVEEGERRQHGAAEQRGR